MYPQVDFLYLSEKDMIKAGVKDMAVIVVYLAQPLWKRRILVGGDSAVVKHGKFTADVVHNTEADYCISRIDTYNTHIPTLLYRRLPCLLQSTAENK